MNISKINYITDCQNFKNNKVKHFKQNNNEVSYSNNSNLSELLGRSQVIFKGQDREFLYQDSIDEYGRKISCGFYSNGNIERKIIQGTNGEAQRSFSYSSNGKMETANIYNDDGSIYHYWFSHPINSKTEMSLAIVTKNEEIIDFGTYECSDAELFCSLLESSEAFERVEESGFKNPLELYMKLTFLGEMPPRGYSQRQREAIFDINRKISNSKESRIKMEEWDMLADSLKFENIYEMFNMDEKTKDRVISGLKHDKRNNEDKQTYDVLCNIVNQLYEMSDN